MPFNISNFECADDLDMHTTDDDDEDFTSSQKEKIDIEQEENISTFKKGRFDNNLSLKTRKEASKVLKKLLEGLDQEYRSDVKDVYYIIENRDKVGIPLVSLKVIICFILMNKESLFMII